MCQPAIINTACTWPSEAGGALNQLKFIFQSFVGDSRF